MKGEGKLLHGSIFICRLGVLVENIENFYNANNMKRYSHQIESERKVEFLLVKDKLLQDYLSCRDLQIMLAFLRHFSDRGTSSIM